MSYYYEKTSSFLTDIGVKRTLGSRVLNYSDERKQEIGLFPASLVSYDYNPYTHKLSAVTWTRYDTDSDFLVANPDAQEILDAEYPGYFARRTVEALSDSAKVGTLINAKKVVFEETASRMADIVGASFAKEYNALSLSDSASTLADNFNASDSDIFSLAYDLQRGEDSDWQQLNERYLSSTTIVDDVIDAKLPFGSTATQILHASWDASAGAAFNFSTDGVASYGISGVTRIDTGEYRVDFTTNFVDSNYTVTTGVATQDYSGTGASPRITSVLARSPSSVTVLCERTDDAVNEDNEYMSVMIIGLESS